MNRLRYALAIHRKPGYASANFDAAVTAQVIADRHTQPVFGDIRYTKTNLTDIPSNGPIDVVARALRNGINRSSGPGGLFRLPSCADLPEPVVEALMHGA